MSPATVCDTVGNPVGRSASLGVGARVSVLIIVVTSPLLILPIVGLELGKFEVEGELLGTVLPVVVSMSAVGGVVAGGLEVVIVVFSPSATTGAPVTPPIGAAVVVGSLRSDGAALGAVVFPPSATTGAPVTTSIGAAVLVGTLRSDGAALGAVVFPPSTTTVAPVAPPIGAAVVVGSLRSDGAALGAVVFPSSAATGAPVTILEDNEIDGAALDPVPDVSSPIIVIAPALPETGLAIVNVHIPTGKTTPSFTNGLAELDASIRKILTGGVVASSSEAYVVPLSVPASNGLVITVKLCHHIPFVDGFRLEKPVNQSGEGAIIVIAEIMFARSESSTPSIVWDCVCELNAACPTITEPTRPSISSNRVCVAPVSATSCIPGEAMLSLFHMVYVVLCAAITGGDQWASVG